MNVQQCLPVTCHILNWCHDYSHNYVNTRSNAVLDYIWRYKHTAPQNWNLIKPLVVNFNAFNLQLTKSFMFYYDFKI
jgi:hypothetical protein